MISIVIVSWNSGEDLAPCVVSMAAARALAPSLEAELIVVDNHSDVPPDDAVKRSWPDARLAILSENIGFGPAVNHAAAHARGEILLLVNPDARAVGDPLTPIAAAFDRNPDWVAVAPRLTDPPSLPHPDPLPSAWPTRRRDEALWRSRKPLRRGEGPPGEGVFEGQAAFQLRRLPTLRQAFRELFLIDRAFPRNRGRLRDRYLDADRDSSFEVEQPAAAVLAIRTDAFARLGGFDPRFVPAWWEDVDLCRRLGALGKIVYYPAAAFAHGGGASMKRLGYARFLPVYYRNAVAYWRKHRPSAAPAFRLMVAAGMLLRIGLLPWRRADPRPKRESFRAYVGAFAAAWS